MDNILVTGGAGFIGSHLTDFLVGKGHGVTVIDSLEPQVHHRTPGYLNGKASYHFGRVNSKSLDYASILRDIDTVYYLASKVGPQQSMTEVADYTECNINNLGYFLQQVLQSGKNVKRIILSSSMAPYGEGKYQCSTCSLEFYPRNPRKKFEFECPECKGPAANVALDESTRPSPISYYGLTKQLQEEILTLFAKTYGIEFVSLRYFSVYGPRQAFGNPYAGPIPIWTGNAIQNKDIMVYEDGNQTRDFISVRDVTNINYLAGANNLPSKAEIINCGTGVPTRIIDVARSVKEKLKSQSNIVVTKTIRPADLRHSLADNSRLKKTLDYTEFVDIYNGLNDCLQP